MGRNESRDTIIERGRKDENSAELEGKNIWKIEKARKNSETIKGYCENAESLTHFEHDKLQIPSE